MPQTSNSRNYRFNPHTEQSYPVTISGEVCLPYYFEEFDDYGFLTEETPKLASPSTFSVTRSGSAQTFAEIAHGVAPGVGQFSVDYDAIDQHAMGFVRINQTDCSGVFLANYQGLGRSLKDNPIVWSGIPALQNRLTAVSGLISNLMRSFHYNWHEVDTTENGLAVIYGSGQFVQVGTGIMTSATGTNWTSQSSYAANTLTGVAYSPTLSGGMYALCSEDGAQRIQTSYDGQSWTPITVSLASYNAIAHGQSTFLAVTSGFCLRSTNGQSWSIAATPNNANWVSIAHSPTLNRFVAVASSLAGSFVGSGTTFVMTSDNSGVLWAERTGQAGRWQRVIWSDDFGRFIAGDSNGQIMTSSDGITWISVNSPLTAIRGIATGNGVAMFSASPSPYIHSTTDFVTFRGHGTLLGNTLEAMSYGAGRFVATAVGQTAAYSDMIEF